MYTLRNIPEPPQEQLNLPCQDLLSDERRRDFINICLPLCKASIIEDWKAAERILQNDRNLVRCSITDKCETTLHVAASAKKTDFVVELLKMMDKEDLLLQTKDGDTALCSAAIAGNVEMARILVTKNEDLLTISNKSGLMPLQVAVSYGNYDMVIYLYEKSNKMKGPEWNTTNKQRLLKACVASNLFDVALKIIKEHGVLDQSGDILGILARKPSAFNQSKSESTVTSQAMQLLKTIWTNVIERPKAKVDKILRDAAFKATAMDNTEFVVELIREYPSLIWMRNDINQSIFHVAVRHRHESIYSLLYEIGSMKDLIIRLRDIGEDNMLHLAGYRSYKSQAEEKDKSRNLAGAAFELQRELLWFKEVESMVPHHLKEEINNEGTPYQNFTKYHSEMVSDAEKWMKEVASQCMLVATLIATVVFAIVFAFPGGYNQNNGFPIFLHKGTFLVFVVFDAISLIASSTSILVFLSIFTSDCDQEDFLESLPNKLLAGLVLLYFSIVTMMVAFSLSFFVLFQERFIGVAIIISILALMSGIALAKLHHRFLKDVFRSQFSLVQMDEEENGEIQTPPSSPESFNLPCQDLLADDRRKDFIEICLPLCKASIIGDWKAAKCILENNRNLVRYSITENCETTLHVAASAKNTDFVVQILKMMNKEDLLLQTITGHTALCSAAIAGNVEMARILVTKNEDLLTFSNESGSMPLSVAASYGNYDMVIYLYDKFNKMEGLRWSTLNKQLLLRSCVESNLFDVALQIIKEHGELDQGGAILGILARRPSAFKQSKSESRTLKPAPEGSEAIKLLKAVWTNFVERPKAEVDEILRDAVFKATEMDNTEFVVELIREYPRLIWMTESKYEQSIFHVAVRHRHESIYSLLYEIGSMKDMIIRLRDTNGNNILHLAGYRKFIRQVEETDKSGNLAGAAFELQRELLWFKEVESMVPHHFQEEENFYFETPYQIFTQYHSEMVSQAEKWMKEVASHCMLVATLIAAVVFAIVFAFPGGYNQDNGFPIFLHKGTFLVFVVFDAISLIASSTSILVFLSIFTSACDQEDFLESLPNKLLQGLVLLYLSIVTMMVAFSLSFFVLFQERFIVVAIINSILALMCGIGLATLHQRFLKDVFRSQLSKKIIFKPKKQLFHYQNPTI
ncbi:hypothetical protein OSB04_014028 [Centaurea solstitialis]|uniref:PGG domain-containing protein n=1 Tax=Centaurea solstitialis TaxID=347529 RepID=A0AA38WQY8_9ASTR|nr:hypothetical protein OSB04_014028 [Centaurea solstitialis]